VPQAITSETEREFEMSFPGERRSPGRKQDIQLSLKLREASSQSDHKED
jgi:hypothetical protein